MLIMIRKYKITNSADNAKPHIPHVACKIDKGSSHTYFDARHLALIACPRVELLGLLTVP